MTAPAPPPFTAEDKMRCAEREVRQRRRVYDRLVSTGRMTSEKAATEIALMEAIAADYRAKASSGDLFSAEGKP